MSVPITPIRPAATIPQIALLSPSTSSSGAFRSVLSDAIGRVEQFQRNSDTAIGKFLSGEDQEVHKVALATQQAEIAFELFLGVRSKVISAYQAVMQMQM